MTEADYIKQYNLAECAKSIAENLVFDTPMLCSESKLTLVAQFTEAIADLPDLEIAEWLASIDGEPSFEIAQEWDSVSEVWNDERQDSRRAKYQ